MSVEQDQLPDRDMAIDGTREDLLRLARDLKQLASETEGDFIDIGRLLQDFFGRSIEMSEKSNAAMGWFFGDDIRNAITDLHTTVDELQGYLHKTEDKSKSNLEALKRIGEELHSSHGIVLTFQEVVKSLKRLGLLIKIESAHLSGDSQGFVIISEEVTRQSLIISSILTDILEKLASLSGHVESIMARFLEWNAEQSGQGRNTIENIVTGLTTLEEKQKTSFQTAERITARTREITGSMSQMVSSMQFHDIVRQRIEHVAEALDRLGEAEASTGASNRSANSRPPFWFRPKKSLSPRSTPL